MKSDEEAKKAYPPKNADTGQELFMFRKGSDGPWKIARYSFSAVNPPPNNNVTYGAGKRGGSTNER